MTNLPVPVPASEQAGNLITGATWNATVYNGLTYLLNPPAFWGYQTAAQSLTANNPAAILLDSEQIDSYGGHSTTSNTSRYVAQVSGYYFAFASVIWQSNATGNRVAQLYKNGSPINAAYGSFSTTAFLASAVAAGIVQLNSGDYLEMYANQGTAVSTQASAPQYSSLLLWFMHA